jgi:hypothetical protein
MSLKTRTRMAIATFAALILLVLAACGGDDDFGITLPTDTPGNGTPADTGDGNGDGNGNGDGGGEAFEETYPVDLTFWFQGFKIEVGDAVFSATEPDFFGEQDFVLAVEATFTNEGENQSFVSSEIALVTASETYPTTFQNDVPDVPGGLSSTGSFRFLVDENFDIDSAYLLLGSADEQRVQVPLGPNGGELITFEPQEIPLTGGIEKALIDMNFTTAELRADDLSGHEQIEAEKLQLTLNFDVTSRKSGNWSVFGTEFALTLPSGSSIPVNWTNLGSGFPGSDAGLDTPDLYVEFLVDDPASGTYTLRWTAPDRWLEEGEASESTYEFEIP